MEQNINMFSKHKFHCDGRKFLSLCGVSKIESSNENQVICIVENYPLLITGKNLHVKKLDVEQGIVEIDGIEQGIVEIDGTIDMLKYQPEKKNILKRLFK